MAGSMQVILTEDIPKLGLAGEVVKVKPGFGRNYLLPQGKAMLATPGRVKQLEHQRRVVAERQRKEFAVQEEAARGLAKVDLTFEMQASSEGKLFGSVTNSDIAERLAEAGFQIDRRKIELAEAIKQVGEHAAAVRLHREVVVDLQVRVLSAGRPPEQADEAQEASDEAEEASDEASSDAEPEESEDDTSSDE